MAALLLSCNVEGDLGCRWRRYVCEDRYTAIRWAIAAAQKGDVVIVSGKGDQDWTEVADGRGGSIRVCSFALIPVCIFAHMFSRLLLQQLTFQHDCVALHF